MPLLKTLILFSSLIWILTAFIPQPLPASHRLHPKLIEAPTQTPLDLDPFTQNQKEYLYTISPQYHYEIQGLIVSAYDSSSWYDIYHRHDPANIKDVCLVWGDNLASQAYRRVNFKSGQFTCYYSWFGSDPGFNPHRMSNNHLIPATPEIGRVIRSLGRGDQVKLSGYLANYEVTRNGKAFGSRFTSTKREDTGSGACEVIYVTHVEILRRPPLRLLSLHRLSQIILTCSLFAVVINFFLSPYLRSHQKHHP
jgi:hypothetical protein